jgi:hypothetical protein
VYIAQFDANHSSASLQPLFNYQKQRIDTSFFDFLNIQLSSLVFLSLKIALDDQIPSQPYPGPDFRLSALLVRLPYQ